MRTLGNGRAQQSSPSARRREREAVLAEAGLAPRLRAGGAVRVEAGAGGKGWSARRAERFDPDRGDDGWGRLLGWALLAVAAAWFAIVVLPQFVRLLLAGPPQ